MSRKNLDMVDKKIIQSLKNNARQSITDLAKDVGISRPTAMKRLDRMIKDKTIMMCLILPGFITH